MLALHPSTKRDITFDYIRITAIFLVVLVHTQMIPLENSFSLRYWMLFSLFFIAKLGVPLFVLLSGTLLLSKTEPIKLFYEKRLQRILLPWLSWALVYTGVKVFNNEIDSLGVVQLITTFFIVALSDFWFMPMIVVLYGITPYLRAIIQRTLSLKFLLFGWFLLVSILPAIILSPLFPGSSSSGIFTLALSFSGYFMLGWYIHQYWQKRLTIVQLVTILLASLLSYLILAHIYQESPNKLFFIVHDYFSPPLVFGSAALFLTLVKMSPILKEILNTGVVIKLSELSLGVYLCHMLVSIMIFQILPDIHFFWSDNQVTLFLGWLIKALLVYSLSNGLIYCTTAASGLKQLTR